MYCHCSCFCFTLCRKEEHYVNGIFQSIGFKEFHDYLILPEEDKTTEEGRKLLAEGLEKMKIATRQYARRQNKWVQNRFIKSKCGGNVWY